MEPWIECVSGIRFEFLDPKPEQILVNDIAHALGNNCRFVGQCRKFYSVAEHSWHVARMLEGTPLRVQLAGLLHDASEAYITDVASPVKQFMPEYRQMEDVIMAAISKKYGLEYPPHPAVKQCDLLALSNESHHLLLSKGNDWDMWKNIKRPPIIDAYRPVGMSPETAAEVFLDKFHELRMAIRLEEKQENERTNRRATEDR
jgi:hypothetical protein